MLGPPVKDAMGVAPRQAIQHLVRERLDTISSELIIQRPHVAFQVVVTPLEEEVKRLARQEEDILQLHDIRVVQLLEQRNLAQHAARHSLMLMLKRELLQRSPLPGLTVLCHVHARKGAP